MKTERLLALVVLLLSRGQVTAKEMAQHFQVSKRTIYRDMVTLERAGFPIVAIHGNEGGYQLMEGFKLHSYTFSEIEKAWLISTLEMQDELVTETSIGQGIIDKLRLLVMSEPAPFQVSLEQGTLHRQAIEDETKEKLRLLRELLQSDLMLQISYVSANGQKTTRKISPRQLRLKNGSWYLLAYCELRQGEREFKVTRIREILALNERKGTSPNIKGPSIKQAKQRIICQFSSQQLGKLYDFFTEKEISELANGDIRVSFEEVAAKNLVPFLLMFGGNVKVIAPESLKEAHIHAIDSMITSYFD